MDRGISKFRDISSLSEIVKIDNILSNLDKNPKHRVLIDTLPRDRHHG